MRSVRVGGHTHSWVVETFLREQEEEEVELEKGGHFAELEHAFQGSKLARISRQEYSIYCRSYCTN
jgi:hypothetical protein